jgi:hypothetical protein
VQRPEHLVDTLLQAALFVLQGKVENIALLAQDAAQACLARGHGKAHFKDKPALAELGSARQQGAAFCDVAGDNVPDRIELPPAQLVG